MLKEWKSLKDMELILSQQKDSRLTGLIAYFLTYTQKIEGSISFGRRIQNHSGLQHALCIHRLLEHVKDSLGKFRYIIRKPISSTNSSEIFVCVCVFSILNCDLINAQNIPHDRTVKK
jgi:hypothetical protein